VRFRKGSTTAYGILEGDTVREIHGDLFGDRNEVKMLYPCTPTKVLAVGLNYNSHPAPARHPPARAVSTWPYRDRQPGSWWDGLSTVIGKR